MPTLIIKESTELTGSLRISGSLFVTSSITGSKGISALPGRFFGNLVGTASYYPVNETLFICCGYDVYSNFIDNTGGIIRGVVVPYSPLDGTSQISWKVRRVNIVYNKPLNGSLFDINNPEYINHRFIVCTSSNNVPCGSGRTTLELNVTNSVCRTSSFGTFLGNFTDVNSGTIISLEMLPSQSNPTQLNLIAQHLSNNKYQLTCTVELSNDNIPLPN